MDKKVVGLEVFSSVPAQNHGNPDGLWLLAEKPKELEKEGLPFRMKIDAELRQAKRMQRAARRQRYKDPTHTKLFEDVLCDNNQNLLITSSPNPEPQDSNPEPRQIAQIEETLAQRPFRRNSSAKSLFEHVLQSPEDPEPELPTVLPQDSQILFKSEFEKWLDDSRKEDEITEAQQDTNKRRIEEIKKGIHLFDDQFTEILNYHHSIETEAKPKGLNESQKQDDQRPKKVGQDNPPDFWEELTDVSNFQNRTSETKLDQKITNLKAKLAKSPALSIQKLPKRESSYDIIAFKQKMGTTVVSSQKAKVSIFDTPQPSFLNMSGEFQSLPSSPLTPSPLSKSINLDLEDTFFSDSDDSFQSFSEGFSEGSDAFFSFSDNED